MEAKVRIHPKIFVFWGMLPERGSSRSIPISPQRTIARMSEMKREEFIGEKRIPLYGTPISKKMQI